MGFVPCWVYLKGSFWRDFCSHCNVISFLEIVCTFLYSFVKVYVSKWRWILSPGIMNVLSWPYDIHHSNLILFQFLALKNVDAVDSIYHNSGSCSVSLMSFSYLSANLYSISKRKNVKCSDSCFHGIILYGKNYTVNMLKIFEEMTHWLFIYSFHNKKPPLSVIGMATLFLAYRVLFSILSVAFCSGRINCQCTTYTLLQLESRCSIPVSSPVP